MPEISYKFVPKPEQFKSDTSVTFAIRKNDSVLTHLDWLLERYLENDRKLNLDISRVILCDLYLTAEYWLRGLDNKSPEMKKGRRAGVEALREAVITELMRPWHLGGTRDMVLQQIHDLYDLQLHDHGKKIDNVDKAAYYFQEQEKAQFRIRFKSGLAYMINWHDVGKPRNLVLAESKYAESAVGGRKNSLGVMVLASDNYGGFVMTYGRDLYMAQHRTGGRQQMDGIYHSSYTGGGAVMMAGTMLIEKGVIKEIRCDSGHYRPRAINLGLCLQGLGMHGVRLADVRLFDFEGHEVGTALEFLRGKMNWKALTDPDQRSRPLLGATNPRLQQVSSRRGSYTDLPGYLKHP